MASFLVETHVAQGDREQFEAGAEGLQKAGEAMVTNDAQVHVVRSYLVPNDEMGVHVVEADSVEVVMRLAKLAGIEVERVVSAIGVDPGRVHERGTGG